MAEIRSRPNVIGEELPMRIERFSSHVRVFGSCTCGTHWSLILSRPAFEQWEKGELVQHAFPGLSNDDRELLVSGTCSTCWDQLWGAE